MKANMMAIKHFLTNEIYDLRQQITSLRLLIQKEEAVKAIARFFEKEENNVIENLNAEITSYKKENHVLKDEIKSKQRIIDEILHQNSQLLKLNKYFNKITGEKENLITDEKENNITGGKENKKQDKENYTMTKRKEDKEFIQKPESLNQSQKPNVLPKPLKKSTDVAHIHEKDQKKIFIVGDSMIKNITGTGISRTNTVKMRPHPGATTIDINDYIKPELRQNPDVVIIHSGTNDLPNNVNTVKKIKKLIKEIEEYHQENTPQIAISSIINRYDQDYSEEIENINDKLKRLCVSKGIFFIDNNNIDRSCLNRGKLHLNKRGSSYLANNFKKFVNAL